MLIVGVISMCILKIVWVMSENVPIFLCAWHVLKTWQLCVMEKIKDVEVQQAILYDMHDVMIMSNIILSLRNTLRFSKNGGELKSSKFLNNMLLVMHGLVISRPCYKWTPSYYIYEHTPNWMCILHM
jgi:hypothetical protein